MTNRHKTMTVLSLTTAAVLIAAVVGLTGSVTAEEKMDHSGHDMSGMESPATKAFMEANMAMHSAMTIPFTGNADVDFIAGMIPHHEGAVEMAKIVLEHGTDPEVRKLAEAIIAAQETEIAFMKDWLARNAK